MVEKQTAASERKSNTLKKVQPPFSMNSVGYHYQNGQIAYIFYLNW